LKPQYYHEKFQMNVTRYRRYIDSSLTEQQRKAVEYLQTARELLKPQYYHEKFQMNVTRYRRYEV